MPSLVVGEACNAFFDDCQGHYYMSSEKGLFRSDYQFGNVQRLGYMQGLNTSMVASDGIFVLWDMCGFVLVMVFIV